MLCSKYQNILYQPRPASKWPPMDVPNRAKQFAPFAALTGLDETIRQKEIIYGPRKMLSEEKKQELDLKLQRLEKGMDVRVTCFVPKPEQTEAGRYYSVCGRFLGIERGGYLKIGDREIKIEDICEIDSILPFNRHL